MAPKYNAINSQDADQDISKILKRSLKDERVAKWAKKRVRSWLLDFHGNMDRIFVGHPDEANLPDWARRVRDNGEDVHRYRLDAGAIDMMRHVDTFLSDLLAYEASDDPELAQRATKTLENLSHHGMRDMHDQADEFYEALNASTVKSGSRSRRAIFASPEGSSVPVEYACESGLRWKRVVPRGLKTVAVALNNCLGGSNYAARVRAGKAEVWCLVNDVPDGEFDPDRDILVAAEIEVTKTRKTAQEIKAQDNTLAYDYVDEIEDFSTSHGFDASSEMKRLRSGGLSARTLPREWDVLAELGEDMILRSKRPTSYSGKHQSADVFEIQYARPDEDGSILTDLLLSYADLSEGGRVVSFIGSQLVKRLATTQDLKAIKSALVPIMAERPLVCAYSARQNDIYGKLSERTPILRSLMDEGGADFPSYIEWMGASDASLFLDEKGTFSPWIEDVAARASNDDVEMLVSSQGILTVVDLETGRKAVTRGIAGLQEAVRAMGGGPTTSRKGWHDLMKAAYSFAQTDEVNVQVYGSISDAAALGSIDLAPYPNISGLRLSDALAGSNSVAAAPIIADKAPGSAGRSYRAAIIIRFGEEVCSEAGWTLYRRKSGEFTSWAAIDPEGQQLHIGDYCKDTGADIDMVSGNNLSLSAVPIALWQALHAEIAPLDYRVRTHDKDASRFGRRDTEFFPQMLIRVADTINWKNHGTDDYPVIRLQKPPRQVGIIPGPDGDLRTGSVAWVTSNRPNGEAVIHHIAPEGVEHLIHTSNQKTWNLKERPNHHGLRGTLEEWGYHFAGGRIRLKSNPEADTLQRGEFQVSRYASNTSPDDRWFHIVKVEDEIERERMGIRPVPYGEPDEARLSLSHWLQASEYPTVIKMAAELCSMVGLKPAKWDRMVFGLELDEDGKVRVGDADLTRAFDLGDGFIAKRAKSTEGVSRGFDLGSVNQHMSSSDVGWRIYRADNPSEVLAGIREKDVQVRTPSAELFTAMSTLYARLEAGTVLDFPYEPETAPELDGGPQ